MNDMQRVRTDLEVARLLRDFYRRVLLFFDLEYYPAQIRLPGFTLADLVELRQARAVLLADFERQGRVLDRLERLPSGCRGATPARPGGPSKRHGWRASSPAVGPATGKALEAAFAASVRKRSGATPGDPLFFDSLAVSFTSNPREDLNLTEKTDVHHFA